jgi:23S rRNA pseudouridine2605 synthase/16S rRNA pseudouridine516 synthase
MARKGPPRWLQAARLRGQGPKPGEPADWLERAFGRAGVMPRAEAQTAIRAGRVTVNGRPETEPMAPVKAGDDVRLDGAPVRLGAEVLALMLHKPAGLVTAGHDPEGVGTVFEHLRRVLPPELQRYEWLAIGRLDRDTTGLLLFTNHERLVAHGARPETHLPKRYEASVAGEPTDAALEPLRRGLTLDDGPTLPAGARLLGPSRVELVLTEGRHHQVKRMLAAVGFPVLTLHRSRVGEVTLDVPEGQARRLSAEELRRGLGFAGA